MNEGTTFGLTASGQDETETDGTMRIFTVVGTWNGLDFFAMDEKEILKTLELKELICFK